MKSSLVLLVWVFFLFIAPQAEANKKGFSFKRLLQALGTGVIVNAPEFPIQTQPTASLQLERIQKCPPKQIDSSRHEPYPALSAPALTPPLTPNDTHGISYNGGPVLPNSNLYHLYYGSWSSNQISLMETFAKDLNGSRFFNLMKNYGDTQTPSIPNTVNFNGSITVGKPVGNTLAQDDIANLVQNATRDGLLPSDLSGIYFVMSSPEVTMDGLCTDFCGWHSYYYPSGPTPLKTSFIANTVTQCPNNCIANYPHTPTGDAGIDGIINVYGHELTETVTDPEISAWYNSVNGSAVETGDLCAWQFGTTYTAPNGAQANQLMGNQSYLIQMVWNNIGSGNCSQGANPLSTPTATVSVKVTPTLTPSSTQPPFPTSINSTLTATSVSSPSQTPGPTPGRTSGALQNQISGAVAFPLLLLTHQLWTHLMRHE